jgi:glycosyltransferase involved in cell wall biosynthesis
VGNDIAKFGMIRRSGLLFKVASRVKRLPKILLDRAAVRREQFRLTLENRRTEKTARRSLIILDDYFPNVLTAFRIAEFNAYLDTFSDALVYTISSVSGLSFDQALAEYAEYYPHNASRIKVYHSQRKLHCKLIYIVFLYNAERFLDVIERDNIPFVLELYPGGTFQLNDEKCDTMLRRTCSSPCFRKMIVTQKVVYDYVLAKNICRASQIEFIYGVVLLSEHLYNQRLTKQRYPVDKSTFDICFVAHKYTERGVDKGYDVFIEVAKRLACIFEDTRFHVVGPYSTADINVDDIESKITFYGQRHTDFFPQFHSRMDLILSPNTPFVLLPGGFDGFPTGACIEAGLCGVPVFCTDVLKMNVTFEDGKDLVIISRDAAEICNQIAFYHANGEALDAIGQQGRETFARVFSAREQIEPRLRILRECLEEAK